MPVHAEEAQAEGEESTAMQDSSPGGNETASGGNETAPDESSTASSASETANGGNDNKPCKDEHARPTHGPTTGFAGLGSFVNPNPGPKKPCTPEPPNGGPDPLCKITNPSKCECTPGFTNDENQKTELYNGKVVLDWRGPEGRYYVICLW